MQVSVQTTSGLERRITVQVPAERIEQEVANRLRNLARRVKMDGFRPGKVPFKVVQRQYDGQVRSEVLSDLMQQTLQEAIAQEKLHPAGGPKFEPKNIESGQALEYSATFEVYPEIKPASMENVSIEKPAAEVTEEDVERMLEKLRRQRITWNVVEREAREEDQVVIDFEGTIDGEAFGGNKGNSVPVVLGSGGMIPGFEEQLIGAKAGEHRTLDVQFPEDYQGKEVAGKAAKFEVDVVSVSEPRLPELNDEFARGFGVHEGGMDALRLELRGNMGRELEQKIRAAVKDQVMDALLERNSIEVPKALVEEEIDRSMQQAMRQRPESMSNLNLPRSLFEEGARRRVTLGLLLGELLRENDIKLDADRVRSTLEEIAASYDDPAEVISAYRKNRSLMNDIEGHVLEEQVVDFLLGQAKVKEKAMSFDELTSPESTGRGGNSA